MTLDVCLVNCNDDLILNKNIDFHRKNNSNLTLKYIICENSFGKTIGIDILSVSGIPKKLCSNTPKNYKKADHTRVFNEGNHHALGLEKSISLSSSKFVILTDPDFFFIADIKGIIEHMELNKLAVVGAPYGIFSEHSVLDQYELPSVNNTPSCFFTIINRELFLDPILMDVRKHNDCYHYTNNLVKKPHLAEIADTSTPFQEVLHKYKYVSFNVCINKNCSICNRELPKINEVMKDYPNYERFFFQDHLVGIHLHNNRWRNSARNIDIDTLKQYNRKIFHPTSIYVQ